MTSETPTRPALAVEALAATPPPMSRPDNPYRHTPAYSMSADPERVWGEGYAAGLAARGTADTNPPPRAGDEVWVRATVERVEHFDDDEPFAVVVLPIPETTGGASHNKAAVPLGALRAAPVPPKPEEGP